jgi:FtsZ-binding cell division protein ZapB
MSLAHEISALETEIEQLRTENGVQRQHIGVLEFENEQLRRANDRINAERDVYLRRSEAIRALLNSTGSMLVNSLRQFHDSEREIDSKPTPQLENTSDRAA